MESEASDGAGLGFLMGEEEEEEEDDEAHVPSFSIWLQAAMLGSVGTGAIAIPLSATKHATPI